MKGKTKMDRQKERKGERKINGKTEKQRKEGRMTVHTVQYKGPQIDRWKERR